MSAEKLGAHCGQAAFALRYNSVIVMFEVAKVRLSQLNTAL